MGPRTLILGGGFRGIAAGVELGRLLGPEHAVVLVDHKPAFTMGLRKLWELVEHATIADGSRQRCLFGRHGIDSIEVEVSSIDTAGRAAETTDGKLPGNHVVIAPGVVSRPDLVPGLVECGHDAWAVAGVPAAARALAGFDGGRIVVLGQDPDLCAVLQPAEPIPVACAGARPNGSEALQ